MSVLIEGLDYEKYGRDYRLLKNQKKQTEMRPPNGAELRTKFGLLEADRMLTLFAGFTWDGATGAFDTDSIMRASLFHDWVCSNVRNRVLATRYRRQGDDLFLDICLDDGMLYVRAMWAHAAVVAYGSMVVNMIEA